MTLTDAPADPGALTISTGDGADNVIDVLNFAGVLPPASDPKTRNSLVRAIRNRGLRINEDGAYAVARAVADPAFASSIVRNDLLTTEVIGKASVNMLTSAVWLTEAFVLMQPRAGGAPHSVDQPLVRGELGPEGEPLAELSVEFADEAHLRAFIIETVTLTRAHGSDYSASILSKRVSRPGLAHVVRICFRDKSEPFYALCVRDGITRVVSSWAALYPDLNDYELGAHVAGVLLASKSTSAANATETSRRARGREAVANRLRGRFIAGTAEAADDADDTGNRSRFDNEDSGPDAGPETQAGLRLEEAAQRRWVGEVTEEAIRIGQTFTLPMQVCVSLHAGRQGAVAPDLVFDDTMQAVIASVHGEFKGWDTAASHMTAVQRAIPRAVAAKDLDKVWAEVALGRMPLSKVKLRNNVTPTPLWRAVYLMSVFTNATEFYGMKKQLRELGVAKSFTKRNYVAHLTGLIDLPWRKYKTNTTKQAWRAWANGGPVPSYLWETGWDPVPTDDFLTLVDDAIAGKVNAKGTLAVAGGIALITDKLLLANVGSAVTSGQVPFRANVDVVIAGLTNSETGLCLLAHAANAFDATRIARNSYTENEISADPGLVKGTYVVPRPDPVNPREKARDSNRVIEALTISDVVYTSDPARADREKAQQPPSEEETDAERAARLRSALIDDLNRAADAAGDLVKVTDSNGAIVGGPLGDSKVVAEVETLLKGLQRFVYLYEPAATENAGADSSPVDDDDLEPGDEDEDDD